MPSIDEKYRPQSWADFVGNDGCAKLARAVAQRVRETRASDALLLTGPSGVGKTTCAWLCIKEAGIHPAYVREYHGRDFDIAECRRLKEATSGPVLGGVVSAILIDEVDLVTGGAEELLLAVLDKPRPGWLFLFTSNRRPGEIFGGVHAQAFARRGHWLEFSNAALGQKSVKGEDGKYTAVIGPGARRVKAVMQAEGFDGRADSYYMRIVNEADGNLGRAICRAWEDAVKGE